VSGAATGDRGKCCNKFDKWIRGNANDPIEEKDAGRRKIIDWFAGTISTETG